MEWWFWKFNELWFFFLVTIFEWMKRRKKKNLSCAIFSVQRYYIWECVHILSLCTFMYTESRLTTQRAYIESSTNWNSPRVIAPSTWIRLDQHLQKSNIIISKFYSNFKINRFISCTLLPPSPSQSQSSFSLFFTRPYHPKFTLQLQIKILNVQNSKLITYHWTKKKKKPAPIQLVQKQK